MLYVNSQTHTQSGTACDKRTQFSTEEANPVVVTEAMRLIFVETDKAIVLVMLVDHIACLVGFNAIVSFSLDKGNTNDRQEQHYVTVGS